MNRLPIQAALLALSAFAVWAPAQESGAPDEKAAAEQTPAPAPSPPSSSPPAAAAADEDDVFVPSEELSAEDEVTFPVDI